ncbi:MAG: TolC family protein [Betaproteobacteria bacterium]
MAMFCASLVAPVNAQGTLSLEQALMLARNRSQSLVAQDAAASAARDLSVIAGQLPDPVLTVGINNLPVNTSDRFSLTDDFMTMRSIGVMQEFTREDKRMARMARYDREAEVAMAGRELALANLERDTAVAWLDRYYQEAIRSLLTRQRDEAKLQVEAAEIAYRSSRGPQVDVIAARAAVAMIDDRIDQSDRQVLTARTMLARWIGAAAGDTLDAAPATEFVPLRTTELETQLAHHPAIAVLAKQEEVAKAEADIARASKQADWSLALTYSQRGPSYSNMVSVNVSFPLQWDQRNRQDRDVSAKLALADQARAQREELLRTHTAETEAMLQEWQSNRERFVRYDQTLIPLAAQRTQAALTAYRGGSGNLTAVLDARRNEIDTRIDRVKLESDTARLWAQLNFLIPSDHPTRSAPR